jgi:hypothetical protein
VLREAGVVAREGQQRESRAWGRNAARGLIENEIYTGKHTCTCGCGESVVRDEWKIVPASLWRKAQPTRLREATIRGDGHIFSGGLIRCAKCGGAMVKSSAGRYEVLRCQGTGGGHAGMSFPKARDYIIEKFMERIPATRVRSGGNAREYEAAQAALADARAAVQEAETLIGVALPSGSPLVSAVADAEDALVEFEEGTERMVWPEQIEEAFEFLSVAEQRRFLRQDVARVVLMPGRGKPACERMRIEFVDGTVIEPHSEPEKKLHPRIVAMVREAAA